MTTMTRTPSGGPSPIMILLSLAILFAAGVAAVVEAIGPGVESIPPLPPCFTPGGDMCQVRSIVHDDQIIMEFYTLTGEPIGVAELLKATSLDAPEFAEAGYGGGWIGYIETYDGFRGLGWGRTMFEYGNDMMRSLFPTEARALYDTAGWGNALMKSVRPENILWHEGPTWVYVP